MTELVFILDRSGSMAGLEADTIGGFNSMIAKQKKEAGEALVSTILFSNDSVVIHDRLPLSEVPPMTEKEYFTRGCTALLDAVGGAIHHIGNIHKYARREDVPEKTLFIITTDGCENASHRYSYETVHRMIERQKTKYGWEFLFLGANIDAAKEAARFGIAAERAANYKKRRDGHSAQLRCDQRSDLHRSRQKNTRRWLETPHRCGCAEARAVTRVSRAIWDNQCPYKSTFVIRILT